MSQSLAKHLAPHGIVVGVVAPGFVETDMAADLLAGPEGDSIRSQSPIGRVARPEEVAQAVLFFAPKVPNSAPAPSSTSTGHRTWGRRASGSGSEWKSQKSKRPQSPDSSPWPPITVTIAFSGDTR